MLLCCICLKEGLSIAKLNGLSGGHEPQTLRLTSASHNKVTWFMGNRIGPGNQDEIVDKGVMTGGLPIGDAFFSEDRKVKSCCDPFPKEITIHVELRWVCLATPICCMQEENYPRLQEAGQEPCSR